MARAGQTLVHSGTGEQLTFLRTAADTGGERLEVAFRVEPGGAPAAPHIHPRQVERWEVHAGRMRILSGSDEQVVAAGESAVVAPGVPHTWVAEGDDALEMTVTLEPALDTERFWEEYFGLAEAGRTNAKGMPSLLHVALLLHDNPDVVYLAKPPVRVQKALFALLAPVARVLGRRRELDEVVARAGADAAVAASRAR